MLYKYTIHYALHNALYIIYTSYYIIYCLLYCITYHIHIPYTIIYTYYTLSYIHTVYTVLCALLHTLYTVLCTRAVHCYTHRTLYYMHYTLPYTLHCTTGFTNTSGTPDLPFCPIFAMFPFPATGVHHSSAPVPGSSVLNFKKSLMLCHLTLF